MTTGVTGFMPVSTEIIGGVDFEVFGPTIVDVPGTRVLRQFAKQDEPERLRLKRRLAVSRHPIQNHQMKAYIDSQGEQTHALMAREKSGKLHLLARGTPVSGRAWEHMERRAPAMPLTEFHMGAIRREMHAEQQALNFSAAELKKLAQHAINVLHKGGVSLLHARVVPPVDRFKGSAVVHDHEEAAAPLISLYEALGWLDWQSTRTGLKWDLPDRRVWKAMESIRNESRMERWLSDSGVAGTFWEWVENPGFGHAAFYALFSGACECQEPSIESLRERYLSNTSQAFGFRAAIKLP